MEGEARHAQGRKLVTKADELAPVSGDPNDFITVRMGGSAMSLDLVGKFNPSATVDVAIKTDNNFSANNISTISFKIGIIPE